MLNLNNPSKFQSTYCLNKLLFSFIVNEDDYPGEDVYVRKFIGYKIDFVMIYVIQSTNY